MMHRSSLRIPGGYLTDIKRFEDLERAATPQTGLLQLAAFSFRTIKYWSGRTTRGYLLILASSPQAIWSASGTSSGWLPRLHRLQGRKAVRRAPLSTCQSKDQGAVA